MISHQWQPLEGLSHSSSELDFQEIDSLHNQWLGFRAQREESNPDAYKGFLERKHRSWAIETGIIEGIYEINQGTTQILVENGLSAELIQRGSTDRDPNEIIKVLKDHQDSAVFVTESIGRQTPLSKQFIVELHQLLTRNQPKYTAVDQFGKKFESDLDHGGFKMQHNNPARPDGLIHEYCPPIQVESEIDNLINLYRKFPESCGSHHELLVAAWLHHRFTQIHPFQDGNGRVARALLTWHMTKQGYLPIVISRDDRMNYIESLESADAGNLNPFVDFIVRLERRMILEALGEPEPVADSDIVDQVMDYIVAQIKRQNQAKQAQMRSVSNVAHILQDRVEEHMLSQATQIRQRLNETDLSVDFTTDRGGPGNREHWYRAEVVRTAQNAQYWVNLNESRFFVKLSINPEGQSRTPRLVFVISLHHVGPQLTGIMAATAFAQIGSIQEYSIEGSGEPVGPDFLDCTVDSFIFTWQDSAETIAPRFSAWIEERLSIALRHWSVFIS